VLKFCIELEDTHQQRRREMIGTRCAWQIGTACHSLVALIKLTMKKALKETQTLRAGCSKAQPKIFTTPQTPSGGAGRPKFNQLEMVTTFTYRPSLVKIDARNFEL